MHWDYLDHVPDRVLALHEEPGMRHERFHHGELETHHGLLVVVQRA
jgi:hypothetical protein